MGKQQKKADVALRMLKLSELKEWDRNPKAHDLDVLITSLKKYGLVRPPCINTSTAKLLYGHGLGEALGVLKMRGDDPPRRVEVDSHGEWLIPTHLIEMEEPLQEPYIVVDNRSTELGGWNLPLLTSILEDVDKTGEMDITGFTAKAFSKLVEDHSAVDLGDIGGDRPSEGEAPSGGKLTSCPKCGFQW